MDMNQFYTRDKANEGIKLPLYTPEGVDTEEWLTILGVDSDEYHKNMTSTRRELLNIETDVKALPKEAQEDFLLEKMIQREQNLLAGLIKDWSFEQECTFENRVEFIKNAPQIAEQINVVAGNRKVFFKGGQNS